MSRRSFSSFIWPTMTSKAYRERSHAPDVYIAFSHRAAPATATTSYRVKAEYATRAYGPDDYHHHHHHSSSSRRHRRDSSDYHYRYATPATTTTRTKLSVSSSSAAYPAYYYGKTSSSVSPVSPVSPTKSTHHHHRRHRRNASLDERVSTNPPIICYGGDGDVAGHPFRSYSSYAQYTSEKAPKAKTSKHVHWADDDDDAQAAPATYHYDDDDDYHRSHVRSSKHAHAHTKRYSYDNAYDDEVYRRSSKGADYYR